MIGVRSHKLENGVADTFSPQDERQEAKVGGQLVAWSSAGSPAIILPLGRFIGKSAPGQCGPTGVKFLVDKVCVQFDFGVK
jgi:hypothetical protein